MFGELVDQHGLVVAAAAEQDAIARVLQSVRVQRGGLRGAVVAKVAVVRTFPGVLTPVSSQRRRLSRLVRTEVAGERPLAGVPPHVSDQSAAVERSVLALLALVAAGVRLAGAGAGVQRSGTVGGFGSAGGVREQVFDERRTREERSSADLAAKALAEVVVVHCGRG